jgi:hypothetical protein
MAPTPAAGVDAKRATFGRLADGSLPFGKRYNVGMLNWGFVDEKTQTRQPWNSWEKSCVLAEPTIWFHEVFRADDMPYQPAETDLIRRLSTAPKGVVSTAYEMPTARRTPLVDVVRLGARVSDPSVTGATMKVSDV